MFLTQQKEHTMERDEYLTKLDLALEHVNSAIDLLAGVDGMERVMEELNMQAVVLEEEIAELDSLDYDEPDHGELVEWQDFDPDC
jgi:hypothetical protein